MIKAMVRPAIGWARRCLATAGLELIRRKNAPYGYSPWIDVRRLSGELRRPLDCIFDVGANTGQTSLQFLAEFPSSDIYAFEPHPTTFAHLVNSVPAGRVKTFQLALSDRTEAASFFEYDGEDGLSKINSLTAKARFATNIRLEPREIKVPCTTLDSFCAEHKVERIGLLKIDTEGYDLFVLKGASRLLSEGRIDFVYAEFNDFAGKPGTVGGSLNALADHLSPFGYHFVATYTDFVMIEPSFMAVASVLAVRAD